MDKQVVIINTELKKHICIFCIGTVSYCFSLLKQIMGWTYFVLFCHGFRVILSEIGVLCNCVVRAASQDSF